MGTESVSNLVKKKLCDVIGRFKRHLRFAATSSIHSVREGREHGLTIVANTMLDFSDMII